MTNAKAAWRDLHTAHDDGALTGTSYSSMINYYDLSAEIKGGLRVLEIGVGHGYSIRGMAECGCLMSALDICDEAFEAVADVATCYMHENSDMLPSAYFDLALSHLVTQHMSEDAPLAVPHIIRSLKSTGRFFVQFAGSDIPAENNIRDVIVGLPADNQVTMLGGRMVRTPEYAEGLVNKCGGKVRRTAGWRRFPKYNSYWYWMEIVR